MENKKIRRPKNKRSSWTDVVATAVAVGIVTEICKKYGMTCAEAMDYIEQKGTMDLFNDSAVLMGLRDSEIEIGVDLFDGKIGVADLP